MMIGRNDSTLRGGAMLVVSMTCMLLLTTSIGEAHNNKTAASVSPSENIKQMDRSDDPSSWTFLELRTWLQQLGLDSFAPVFEKHRIGGDILFDMTRAEIVDLMARENALVYGEVLRLDKAMRKKSPRSTVAPHRPEPHPHMQEQPTRAEITHGVTHALLGWSFGGITLTALIIALAISAEMRKMVNVMAQLLSIHLFFVYRRVIARFKPAKSPSKPTPKSPASMSSGETSPSPVRKKVENSSAAGSKRMDFTGEWKLETNKNYKELLAFMGASFIERNAANSFATTNVIEHNGDHIKISIRSLITVELDYIIGGPSIQTEVKGTKFEDTVTWMENGGVAVRKHCKAKKQEIMVQRQLQEGGKVLCLSSHARNLDGSGTPISCLQMLRRVK